MTTRIYLIRHGATILSAEDRFAGATDVDLSEEGRRQAEALALRLFLVPARLASGGVSGLAQIANYYTGWPIGVMILLGNLAVRAGLIQKIEWDGAKVTNKPELNRYLSREYRKGWTI